ncbi:MAG: hypothetical protein HYX59_09180 [Elusimicrobia bacterium]|nr:hypothetical protein [Elusimicrobiota bacterium]
MDQQPKIPTLKDAQKPQVKIKGMGAGLTLFDRLKQFKKKDLAFILAGLGTLFMAPLAEHFMMAPENGDVNLQKGWGGGSGGAGGGIFGSGSSPYENGNNNIASGGAIGGAGDIITPLNVRDPSALVMGPGAAQQPNAGSAAPAAPPPTAPARSETDYKDALSGAAARAASAAVKRAPLPVPKVALGGSGLRGLGVAGGGTSASGSLGPIGPAAGSTGGGGGSGLNLVRNAPGFRSAVGPRSPTGGIGLDGTKKAGQNAGDAFSRTGSALSGLNAAANEQIPTGGQGFGGGGAGGAGANDKPYSGSGPGGSKSVGESLAFLAAKQRQEESLKLEFEKRKLKDPELLLYGIRNDSLKAIAQEMTKSLSKSIVGFMDGSKSGGSTPGFFCSNGSFYPDSSEAYCLLDGKYLGTKSGTNCTVATPQVTCQKGSKSGDADSGKPDSKSEQAANDARLGNIAVPAGATPGTLGGLCTKIEKTDLPAVRATLRTATGSTKTEYQSKETQLVEAKKTLANIVSAQDVLSGSGTPDPRDCGAQTAPFTPTTPAKSVKANVEAIRAAIGGADGKGGLVKTIQDAMNPAAPDKMKAAKTQIEALGKQWTETDKLLAQAEDAIKNNAQLTLNSFGNAVLPDKSKFDTAYADSKSLAESLRKAVNNIKPAVDGIEAAGAKLDGKASEGSAKFIAQTSVDLDKAYEKAKLAEIADETDPKKKVKLMTDNDIPAKPEGTSALKQPAGGAPASGTGGNANGVLVQGAKEAVVPAEKASTALGVVMTDLDGDDAAKKKAREALKKVDAGSIAKDVADAVKTQVDVLTNIGAASDQSTRAPAAK